jgi:PAS domain S-box-containing protein
MSTEVTGGASAEQQVIFDSVPAMIWFKDTQNRITRLNQAAAEAMGLPAEEIEGKSVYELNPDEADDYYQDDLEVIDSGAPKLGIVEPLVTASGETRWLQTDKIPYRDAAGRITGVVVFATDITERKRAEEMLEEQRAFLRQVIDIDPNFLFVKDRQGRFVLANKALTDAYGTTVDDIVGKTDADFNPNLEEVEHFRRDDLEVIDSLHEKFIPEEAITDAAGNVRWLQTSKRPVVDRDGVARRVLGVATDITGRKQVEEALKRAQEGLERRVEERTAALLAANAKLEKEISDRQAAEEALRVTEERFALAVRGSQDGIWDWDIQNDSLYWSPRLKELLGYAVDELDVDFAIFDSLMHPDDKERVGEAIDAHLGDRATYDVEERLRTKSGEYRWFRARGQAVWDEVGQPVRMSGSITDVTESKRAAAERERLLADLVQRSNQLQTAAEVSHAATGILDPEELIQQVVDLVQARFGLYYVGLFLVDRAGEWTDEAGKWAVLRAGSGEAGQQMLSVGHKLEIGGESMIGWCVANQQARIALDVGEEAVRFDNPYLPETRSEMALPLIARGQAVGAMTVQSEEQAAFSDEDIAVLQTMADQVANAIENARLLEETQHSADRERLVGEITARMRETLDMDTVLKTAIREMGDTLGLAKVEVRLTDEIAQPENGHGEGEASVES